MTTRIEQFRDFNAAGITDLNAQAYLFRNKISPEVAAGYVAAGIRGNVYNFVFLRGRGISPSEPLRAKSTEHLRR